jgi:hypothetical protein
MYTPNQLIDLLHRRLSNGDVPSDSPYDRAFLWADLQNAIREDLKLENLNRRHGPEDDKSAIAQMIATYLLTVQTDKIKTEGRVYVALPDYFIAMKYNRGIHSIVAKRKPTTAMVRALNPHVTQHLPHREVENVYYWYAEGYRVYWMRNIVQDGIEEVYVKLITGAPDSYGMDDILPLLSENVSKIIDVCYQRNLGKFPQDRIADNNPNLRNANESQR